VWDLAGGGEITTFNGHAPSSLITGIAFSPDGKSVFTGADDTFVYRWDAATGRKLDAFSNEGKELFGVALSPDGSLLAAGDQDGSIILWDVRTGEKLHKLSGHAGLVLRLAFNSDGTLLASASHDRLAKVWEVASGQELFGLYGNASNVFGVSFNPDSTRLATAGADGTVRTYTLNLDDLAEIAYRRLTRDLTQEECRNYLHVETCPPLPQPASPNHQAP
jgi:WD40 repeat protein